MVKQLYYGRFPEDSPVPPYFHKPQQQFQYVHLPVDKLGLDSQFLFLVECGPAPLDGDLHPNAISASLCEISQF